MAYLTNTRGNGRTDISSRVSGYFGSLSARYAQYRVYRNTLDELRSLSDRELADLGLHRSAVRNIAHQAAYGNAHS